MNVLRQTTIMQILLAAMKTELNAEYTLMMIKNLTDETFQDLIPELAFCVVEAKAGLNRETSDYIKSVLDEAFARV